MSDKKEKIQYFPGIFDVFKHEDRLDFWSAFPGIMWGLGYEMDCCRSFEEYSKLSPLKLQEPHTEREEKRNILYLLEHADRQIVGNYLFSEWRYWTHWAMAPASKYDVDFLRRIIAILEAKYEEK